MQQWTALASTVISRKLGTKKLHKQIASLQSCKCNRCHCSHKCNIFYTCPQPHCVLACDCIIIARLRFHSNENVNWPIYYSFFTLFLSCFCLFILCLCCEWWQCVYSPGRTINYATPMTKFNLDMCRISNLICLPQ